MEAVEEGENMEVGAPEKEEMDTTKMNGMTLMHLPPECWLLIVPPDRVIMMSMTSNAGKEKMERASAAADLYLNMSFWYTARRSNERKERQDILAKVGALAQKYRITTLGLMSLGMTSEDFGQLAGALEKCKGLKVLELPQNEFGSCLRNLIHIASITSLTTLNLKQGNNGQIKCALSLSDIVTYFPMLENLSLEGNKLGFVTGPVAMTPVRPALKFLCLKENWLRVDGLLRVKEVLGKCPGLTHLDLSHNSFMSEEMDELVGMFSQCTLLSYLNLDGNDMQHDLDADLTLAAALSPLEALTDLNLQFNQLDGFLHLGVVLTKCTGLEYLDLGVALIGNSGATTLAGVLGKCPRMRMLNLSTNRIEATGTEAIAAALEHCVHLRGLNMANNLIWTRGAEALAVVVGNVQYLSLSNCGIGARGCEALAETRFDELDDLDVSGNSIHEDGMDAIAGAAGNWQALKSLCISNNALGAHGMHAAVRVLRNYKNLTNLQTSSNNLQDEGVEILTHGLVECERLSELSLANNNITDAGATCLASILPRCTTLRELFISYNENIGPAGIQVLRDAEEGSELTVDVRKRLWRRVFVGGGS